MLDLDFIKRNTKVLEAHPIFLNLNKTLEWPYILACQDMDKPLITHVYSGNIYIGKADLVDQNEMRELILENFPDTELSRLIANNEINIHLIKSNIAVGKSNSSYSQLNTKLSQVLDNILNEKTNRKRLVLSSINEAWEYSLLHSILPLIQPPKK